MLHEETDGVATAAAAEALVDLFGRRYREGRGLLIVERAEAKVVGAPFLELDEAADDLDDVDAAEDLLYGVLGDQACVPEPRKLRKTEHGSRRDLSPANPFTG